MFQITITQKVQWLHEESFLLHAPTKNLHEEKKQNTKGNVPKWSQKLKSSLFMRISSKFIYIVFSVSAMCCKMSLHGMHGSAPKSTSQRVDHPMDHLKRNFSEHWDDFRDHPWNDLYICYVLFCEEYTIAYIERLRERPKVIHSL